MRQPAPKSPCYCLKRTSSSSTIPCRHPASRGRRVGRGGMPPTTTYIDRAHGAAPAERCKEASILDGPPAAAAMVRRIGYTGRPTAQAPRAHSRGRPPPPRAATPLASIPSRRAARPWPAEARARGRLRRDCSAARRVQSRGAHLCNVTLTCIWRRVKLPRRSRKIELVSLRIDPEASLYCALPTGSSCPRDDKVTCAR